jgi:hypothetical protein
MDIEKRLKEAAEAGEVITVVYHGGSQPGTKRDISPIKVSKTEVLARCLVTGQPRSFRLSKLEIVRKDYPAKAYEPTTGNVQQKLVEQAIKLPSPPATPELISHAESLGIKLSTNTGKIEAVLAILSVLIERHHIAQIEYSPSLYIKPYIATIEPYAFQKSKEGIRLRCWATEPDPYTLDYQTEGWRLYLVNDIESVRDTGKSFIPKKYRKSDALTITFRVDAEGIFSMDLEK